MVKILKNFAQQNHSRATKRARWRSVCGLEIAVREVQMFELAIRNPESGVSVLPPQVRFISTKRMIRPVMERLERRHFFSALHHQVLPPAPPANLPPGTLLAAAIPNATAQSAALPTAQPAMPAASP